MEVCARRASALFGRERWHQSDVDGVEGGLRAALDIELAEDAADVRLHGFLADAQVARDLLVGAATSEEPEHVGLAIGKGLAALRRAHFSHEPGGGLWRQLHLARGGGLDGAA